MNILMTSLTMLVCCHLTLHKPVPDTPGDIANEGRRQAESSNSSRGRRGISDVDATNPSYHYDGSSFESEMSGGGRDDVSFAFGDQINNFFRGHKPVKQERTYHPRPVFGDRGLSIGKEVDVESVESAYLPADEQEECYKQQNIDPPVHAQGLGSHQLSRAQDARSLPIMNIAQAPQTPYVPIDVSRNEGVRMHKTKNEDMSSLYSGSGRNKNKQMYEPVCPPKYPDYHSKYEKVYKPVGIEASFPVYDEDIDFHPDPLQGILDDKYWTDPAEQESVIRKYIDLANNNMIPPGMEFAKRSVEEVTSRVKIVNSEEELKGQCAEGECRCKEVVACGECSKGKEGKKNNSTNMPFNTRKLLSLGYENMDDILEGDNGFYDEKRGEAGDTAKTPSHSNYLGRKLLSINERTYDDEGIQDEMSYENGVTKTLRKENLASKGTSREFGEYYDPYYNKNTQQVEARNTEDVLNRRTLPDDIKYHKIYPVNYKTARSISPINAVDHNREKINIQHELTDFKPITDEEVYSNNHFVDWQKKSPGYYTPNKFANVLQKPLQKKPKGPKTKIDQVDPSREFESLKNETFKLVSQENMTEVGGQNITLKKERYELGLHPYPKPAASKGHRRHVEKSFNKRAPVLPLVNAQEESQAFGYREQNKTSNSSQSGATSPAQSAANVSKSQTNHTPLPINDTNSRPTPVGRDEKNSRKNSDDEEAVDAEVANDIVETVISESQRGSVLGHNLGLCRRNESVMNVKYGKIVPETEKVLRTVTDCIMNRLKSHLAKQSCILLDAELVEFLKWLVLSGEPHKDYMQKIAGSGKHYTYLPKLTTKPPKTPGPSATTQNCEETLPPHPTTLAGNMPLFD